MLRPINTVPCTPALHACRQLQVRLFEWLCDPAVGPHDITEANAAARVPTQAEADWLWAFLQKVDKGVTLLDHAREIAGATVETKTLLITWVRTVSDVPAQFGGTPPVWPTRLSELQLTAAQRKAVGSLALSFYTKGLKATKGLPYDAAGVATTVAGVTYTQFVQEFRDLHRANPDPHAHEVCVLCGGPLGSPEMDHWILESAFPILSVCGHNLIPACGECNSPACKGQKPVFKDNPPAFADWFHPYCRHAGNSLVLSYDLPQQCVVVTSASPAAAVRVRNLDDLLCLSSRWSREFKAKYSTITRILKKRVTEGRMTSTPDDIAAYIQNAQADLLPSEPHAQVHQLVLTAALEPPRLAAWETELNS